MGIDLDWSESPIVKQMYEKGLEEGLEKGLEKGREEGIKGLKDAIFNLLEFRFEKQDLGDVVKKIEAIKDIEKLKVIHREILKHGTLKEFQAWLEGFLYNKI